MNIAWTRTFVKNRRVIAKGLTTETVGSPELNECTHRIEM